MNLYKIVGILLSLYVLNYVVTNIMNFFGVSASSYIIYMAWLFALVFFYIFLPRPKKFFENL